ncbi:MAG: hypothetical protein ACF8SC_04820 [Phycisphaerales bacterium JB037]
MTLTRSLIATGIATLGATLAACGSSGPRVGVNLADAVIFDDVATLQLEVFNNSGRSLTLKRIDYTLADGTTQLADSTFRVSRALPASSIVSITLPVLIDGTAASPDASSLSLTGTLNFERASGEGVEAVATPFAAEGPLTR